MKKLILTFTLALIFIGSSFAQGKTYSLRVVIDGLISNKGKGGIALVDQAGNNVATAYANINDGECVVSFDYLDKGYYAVKFFHDENNNRRLDMSGKLPKEGYAFSNISSGIKYKVQLWDMLFSLEEDTEIFLQPNY